MRLCRHSAGWLTCLALVATVAAGRAEAPPDPLRLVPDRVDFFFKIEQPRQLVETVYYHALFKQFWKIDAVRETYDSTNARRFYQLIAYLEKQLGSKWPDLLDRLAGGGTVVATRLGGNPAPTLFVVQGKDEKLVHQFFKLALEVIGQELARQEAKDRPVKGSYRRVETVQIGKQFYAAAAGSALLFSNHPVALQTALDLHLDGGKASAAHLAGVAEARKVLPANPLAWGWLNLETVRKAPQAKVLFANKQNDTLLTVAFGGLLDIARRSPFLCAGVYYQDNRLLTTFRTSRGREGLPDKLAVFVPPANQAGSLPLLEPRHVLLSTSYYLDLSRFWEDRSRLFNDKQVKTFEEFDKNSGRFLSGVRFSTLLKQAGRYQRVVIAQQTDPGYKTRPSQLFPAGAFVLEMRQPEEFSRTMETILRGAALLTSGQSGLTLVEEKKGQWNIVGYRFAEGGKATPALRGDTNNIRFNFSPCFVRVGNTFVISSTIELARELVDLLDREARDTDKKGCPATVRTQLYASGGAASFRVFRDQLLTQTILNRAVSPSEAEKQVDVFIELFARLGVLQIKQEYTRNSFHYDIQWQLGK